MFFVVSRCKKICGNRAFMQARFRIKLEKFLQVLEHDRARCEIEPIVICRNLVFLQARLCVGPGGFAIVESIQCAPTSARYNVFFASVATTFLAWAWRTAQEKLPEPRWLTRPYYRTGQKCYPKNLELGSERGKNFREKKQPHITFR